MANKQTYTTAEEIDAMRERIANAKLKGTKKHSKLLPILGGTLFTIVVLLLVGILITVNIAKRQGKTPDLFGYRLFMVETGSMEPGVPVGSILLVGPTDVPSNLSVDSIVSFTTQSGTTVTHRIIGVLKTDDGNIAYRTKGDNPLNSPDPELLTPDRVIGIFILKIPMT